MGEQGVRDYELVVVIGADVNDQEQEKEQEKIQQFLESHGAKDLRVESWGKREMTFQVGNTRYGTYLAWYFTTENTKLIEEISAALRINDAIALFQAHRITGKTRKYKGNADYVSAEEAA